MKIYLNDQKDNNFFNDKLLIDIILDETLNKIQIKRNIVF